MKPILFFLAAALTSSCHNPPAFAGSEGISSAQPVAAGPAPIVIGTVLDARTGKPIAGALVRGPGGLETKSDAHGRFVLRGLALGISGDLVGRSAAGLTGKNLLRALESGPLEVVLHLR